MKHLLRLGHTCNNNCTYCHYIGRKCGYTKTLSQLKQELNAGSELTLPCNSDIRDDLLDIVRYAKKEGHTISLQTNGRIFWYPERAKDATPSIDTFEVFLSGTEHTHDSISRTKSYEQTIRGIRNLKKLGASIQVNTVIMKNNVSELQEIVKVVRDCGVKRLRFIYPLSEVNNQDIPMIDATCYDVEDAIKLAEGYGITVVRGDVFHNPFIHDDLDMDYSGVEPSHRVQEHPGNIDISVIIPAYNRKEQLELTLTSLFHQDFPKDKYEIVIVDDGSTDGTEQVVKKLNPPCNLTYFYWPRNKPYVFGEAGNRAGPARNLGVKFSKGKTLIFLDSDIICEPDFFTRHKKRHQQEEKAVVFGLRKDLPKVSLRDMRKIVNGQKFGNIILEDDFVTKLLMELNDRLETTYLNYSQCEYPWLFFMSHSVSVKRKHFSDFDHNFVFYGLEDQEWMYRCYRQGLRVAFDKQIKVYHQPHKSEFIDESRRRMIYLKNLRIFYSKHLDSSFIHYDIFPKHYMGINDRKKLVKVWPLYAKRGSTIQLIERDKESNYKINKQELLQQKSKLTTYPSRLYIELTRNCNMKCRMCYRSRIHDKQERNMPFRLYKKIADELFPYAKFVDLRGFGESTILSNFLEYVDYALKFDCDFGIITNLSVRNDKMWEHLIKNDFWIGISIDGPDKETYGRIRDESCFDQVIGNIKLLVKLSGRYQKDINRLYFLVVVQKDNVEHLTDFIDLSYKLGIKRIEFKPVRSNNNSIWLQDIQDLTRKQVRKAVTLAKKHKIRLTLTGSFFNKEFEGSLGYERMDKCPRPWSHLYVAYNGFIGPCNHQFNLFFGSLKYWGINDIWNGGHYRVFRKITNTPNRPERCDNCFECYFDNEWS